MKEYTFEEVVENQKKLENKNVVKVTKPQVKMNVMMFNDQGQRIIPGVQEEVVEKTQTNTKVQFKTKEGHTITSKTHIEQESEFLM